MNDLNLSNGMSWSERITGTHRTKEFMGGENLTGEVVNSGGRAGHLLGK